MNNRKKEKNHKEQQIAAVEMKADKTHPYPKHLFVVKDPIRSDIVSLNSYGSAYMTVKKTADDSTVSYIREDVINKKEGLGLQRELQQIRAEKEHLENKLNEQKSSYDSFLASIIRKLGRRIRCGYISFAIQCCIVLGWNFVSPQQECGTKGIACLIIAINMFNLYLFIETYRDIYRQNKNV